MTARAPKTIVEAEGMVPESWWLTSTSVPPLRPALQGPVAADVVIVGGGFTGLWTAYELLRRNPKLRVVVLERDRVGSGASGRNGGWCVPELNIGPARLAERFGSAAARGLRVAMKDTVGHISAVLREEAIDADFERSGVLLVARGPGQLSPLEAMAAEFRDAGWGDDYQRLGSKECQKLVEISQVEGGLFSECGASVHPGKLVRGLALAVERRGGVIYERSTVDRILSGRSPLVETSTGEVRAAVVVLGLEAYLSQLARFHRRVLPLYSLIVLTEPLSPPQLEEIGWRRRVLVSSMRLSVDYLNRTVDGRVLVGGRGAPYSFGSAIRASSEHHAATHSQLRQLFRVWFPSLSKVAFTHAWGGVLGMPRDWMPQVGYEPAEGLAWAYGYTGHGVATSNLAGRTLADLITGTSSELTSLPLVGHRSPNWEVEPLRWLGVRFVQAGLGRVDARVEVTGIPPTGRTIAERIGSH